MSTQICSKCSQVNPPQAVYCFHDGALLSGANGTGGPINPGAMPFPTPFIFPTGQNCANFDQLAMACQHNWKEASDMLKQGFFYGFFGGMGRADLAMAAQKAAEFPDVDRGLDELIEKFPTEVLEPPKLKVEPTDINLGTVIKGQDKHFEIHLTNQGMRILHGTIISDSKWLTIGDGPGQEQKLFQLADDSKIPVHIMGHALRAGSKPLVGKLEIESNGGNGTIQVRVEVPVKPFPSGVLAGAKSPRQVAEKAKAAPKEAAVLFENGTVSKWFTENGWTYPVQGPSASGLGAVQQFFEALGLARAPKVLINQQALQLQGNPGERLETTIEVNTPEKRPVYAHATCNEQWLDVSQTKLNGRFATIHVVVPSVPQYPGHMFQANIRVAANGNQRFAVPITLNILGAPGQAPFAPEPFEAQVFDGYPEEPIMAAIVPEQDTGVMPMAPPPPPPGMAPPPPPPPPSASAPPPPPPPSGVTPQPIHPPAPTGVTEDPNDPFSSFALGQAPVGHAATAPTRPGTYTRTPTSGMSAWPMWMHLIPMGCLLLALLIPIIFDLLLPASANTSETADANNIPINPVPVLRILYDNQYLAKEQEDVANLPYSKNATMKFGVIIPVFDEKKKKDEDKHEIIDKSRGKPLTYGRTGSTNSTLVKIDTVTDSFGGAWGDISNISPTKTGEYKYGWEIKSLWGEKRVSVVQKVELIPGIPLPLKDGEGFMRWLDTCLVRYEITNNDSRAHTVSLKYLLDTKIGENDGVPFFVPGKTGMVTWHKDFDTANTVPDSFFALEKNDLKNPGTVMQVNLKVRGLIPPSRVILTQWPGLNNNPGKVLYDWETETPKKKTAKAFNGDSSVVMYWENEKILPGKTRTLGFSFGLGHVASETGSLGVFVSGDTVKGGDINVLALVSSPKADQKVTLKLPSEGLEFAEFEEATQIVPKQNAQFGAQPVPVNWQLKATKVGTFDIEVTSGDTTQKKTITIEAKGSKLFN